MEHLRTYESDDESCPESETEVNLNEERKTTNLSDNSNFFNLKTSPANLGQATELEQNSMNDQNNKEEEDKDFEIPDSDFWTGFKPSQNYSSNDDNAFKNGPITSHSSSNYRKYQRSCPSPGMETNFLSSSVKRSMASWSTESMHSSKRLRRETDDSGTNKSNAGPRKIFFVHNKVMPALSATCPICRIPSRIDSSWPCHDSAINRLSWNIPNYSHLVATAGMDSLVKIYNVWSSLDKCVSSLTTHSKAVRMALWGHTGRTLISCSYDRTAAVSDVETGKALCKFEHCGFVTACVRHPSNYQCFATGSENIIQMWDQRSPVSPVKTFQFKNKLGQVQDLLFIHDGAELLSCTDVVARESADRTIMAWDTKSGVVLSNQIFQERFMCTRLKLHPSNSQFLAQTQGGYVAAFSTNRPYKMDKSKRFEGHQMQGYNIGFDLSHDGKYIYSGSAEGGIHCYDHFSGRLIKNLSTNKNTIITDVASHPVLPSVLAGVTWGGHLNLWH